METYRVIRIFQHPDMRARAVRGLRRLSLEEAQAACRGPETSSSTCRSSKNRKLTDMYGPWFLGYDKEK